MSLLKFDTILVLFQTYKKLLERQIKALKEFDMDAYSRLHPDRMRLSLEYQRTVNSLVGVDLKKLNIPGPMRQQLLKTLQAISHDLEVQKKYLHYAQKSQERLSEIYRNYAQRISLTTYAASGYQHVKRQSMIALSEMS